MEFEELIKNGAALYGVDISDKILEQVKLYYEMIIEKNKVMNLTAITEPHEFIKKHFLDSISLASVILELNGKSIIDIGTGAGFPGIPLKLVFPDAQILLLDSLNKRVGFLNEVIEKLDLKGISAVHGRAEELARNEKYREKFDLAASRAVAGLNVLSEYALPFVKVGGLFAAYKSQKADDEIVASKNAVTKLGGRISKMENIDIYQLEADRKLVLIQKVKHTPDVYPRAGGKISKSPL